MSFRIGSLVLIAVLFAGSAPAQGPAQTPAQPAGAAVPGPAAPRPQTPTAPPRDGALPAAPSGTGKVRGRVVSAESGNPLRRAQVRLSSTTAGQAPLMQMATTDADGRYEFTKLPASRYTLMVSRIGYVMLQFGQQRPFEPGKTLTLAEGEVADKIDFALPRGGVITGRVTDDTGEPIPGVRLQAQRYQYMPGGQRRLVPANTGGPFGLVSDDLGQFRIYGLMPGAYVVSAMPQMDGFMMGPPTAVGPQNNDGFATTYYPGTANVEEAQPVNVELGQEAAAFFSLVSARLARISGVIRNSQGSALSGRVSVSLRTPSGAGYNMTGGGAVAPDGSFTISNVSPGEHFIDVRPMMMGPPAPGAAGQPVEEEFASIPVTVSGQDITGLVITTGIGAVVTGRVIFEGNSPRPPSSQQVRVFTQAPDPSQSFSMPSSSPNNGLIDESGRFQMRGANGQVLFRTGAQGWTLKSVTLNGVDITDTPLDVKPPTNVSGVEIVLTDHQTTLSGAVKTSAGEPVKDFVVAIFPSSLRDGMVPTRFIRTVRPDQQGRYQIKGLPPGDYVAVAISSLEQGGEWDPVFQQQMKPRGRTFRLNDAESATLDLTLIQ